MHTSENFALLILRSLEANPGKVFLRIKEKKDSFTGYTGSEIKQEVFSRLHQLKRKPAQAVLFIPFGSEHIFWTIALMLRGVTLLDLPIKNLKQDLITGPKRTIILPQQGQLILGILFWLQGNRIIRFQINGKDTNIRIDPSPDDPALVSFSSGSKGIPKRFDRSHYSLIQQHLALEKAFPTFADQVDFPLFPLTVLHNLAFGISTVLPPLDWDHWENFYAGDMMDSIVQEQVTSLTGNVFYFHKLLRSAKKMNYVLSGVKEVHIGGSPAPEWILADIQTTFPNARVFILYGTTEAEPIAIREYKRQRDPLLGYCVG
ncbi:MAG: AMP-binding protein, partial [Bacteroidia bacterium]